jgi:hypothetical protein
LNSTSPSAPAPATPDGDVRDRGEERAELDGQRDGHRRADGGDHLQVAVLQLRGRDGRVGGDRVEVQLDGVGARVLQMAGVPHPAARRGAVEAGDHWDRGRPLGLLNELEVRRRPGVVVGQVGEVGQRLADVLGGLLQQPVQLDLVVGELLLEQRWQHRGGHAGILEPAQVVGSPVRGEAEATSGERSSSPR